MKSNDYIVLGILLSIIIVPLVVGYIYVHFASIKEKAKLKRLSRNSKRVTSWFYRMGKRYEGEELDKKFAEYLRRNTIPEDREYMTKIYRVLAKRD